MKNTFGANPNQFELSFVQKVVTPEAYYVLNDFCNPENYEKAEAQGRRRLALGDVYRELEALDRPLLSKLKDHELKSRLEKDECLTIAVFLLSSKQIGPHAEAIESAIMSGYHEGDIRSEVDKLSIPGHAKNIISGALGRLFSSSAKTESLPISKKIV